MLTRQGWLVVGGAAALFVAKVLFGPLEFFIAGVTLLALVAGAVLFVRTARLRIVVDRDLHPPRVHAGTPSRVDLRIANQGRRDTPVLGLRDAVSGTRGANLLISPLPPGDAVRAAYRLPTERRGVLSIGPLEITLTDPFGLTRTQMQASDTTELTVYPKVDQILPVPQTTGNDPMAGAEHPNALGRSGEDFYALRPYVVGDDLRRVHWPSTARHDELMVRQDELPWQGRATLVVDVRRSTNSAESLELVVSAAASIVNASARRQDLIRLVSTDGFDSGFAAGHAHIEGIMEHLACVEGDHEEAFDTTVDRLVRSATGGALVAVVADLRAPEHERLGRLRNRFGSFTVVRFDLAARAREANALSQPATTTRDGVLVVWDSASFVEGWTTAVCSRRNGTRRPLRRRLPAASTDSEGDDDRWTRRVRMRP